MREHVGCARTRREATHPIDLHMVLVTYRWPAPNTRASGRPRAAAPFRGAAGRGPNPGRRSGRRAVDSSRSREDMREDCSRRIRYRSLGEVTNYVLSCSEVETKRLRTCWVPCSSTVLRVHAVVRRPRPCLSMARLNHRLNGASSGASPRPLASRPSPHHTHTVPRARPCARVVIGRSL
jgi:hypothetical protein